MAKYFESNGISREWYDEIKSKVEHKNLAVCGNIVEADFEYYAFYRESVKAGYMYEDELPAVDLVDRYNRDIGINLKNILLPIEYNADDIDESYRLMEDELKGIEWLIERLESAKEKLEDAMRKVDKEAMLGG